MDSTADASPINLFNRLPNELLEKIFFSLTYYLPLTPNNHVRLESNSYYFDYSIQQPLLKQNHTELLQVSLVCRRFHQIISTPRFWERKCRQEHILLSNQNFSIDFTAYEKLYINNPFHPAFNLLEDNNWTKSEYSVSQIEPIPLGSHRLYDEFNRLSPCRATSYTKAKFFQRNVQLPCKGSELTEFVHLRPVIEFSICVAARWECGSRCSISLLFSDRHHWQCKKVFSQWNDQKWHRLTYRYGQYEQFPSLVTICLDGRDTQFWRGFYGIKFAQARLHLLLRTNENETNAESAVVIEPKAKDELIEHSELPPIPDNLPIDGNSSSTLLTSKDDNENDYSFDYD